MSVYQLKMQNHIDGPKAEHVRGASDFLDDRKPEKSPMQREIKKSSVRKYLLHQVCTETSRSGSETAQLSLSPLMALRLVPLEMPQRLQPPIPSQAAANGCADTLG